MGASGFTFYIEFSDRIVGRKGYTPFPRFFFLRIIKHQNNIFGL